MVEARPTTPAQSAAIDTAVNKVLDQTHTPETPEPTLPTLKSHRPSGLRARFAALMTVPALVLAACGVGDKPPATPTTLPTNTPGATQSFEPSPSAQASPSFEVTPPPPSQTPVEATPTPEPVGMNTIVNGKHDAVNLTKVEADLTNALDNNPDAAANFPNALTSLQSCKSGDPSVSDFLAKANQMLASCERIIVKSYEIYQATGDANFLNTAKDSYNYTISTNGLGASKYNSVNGLGKEVKQTVDKYLEKVGLLPATS